MIINDNIELHPDKPYNMVSALIYMSDSRQPVNPPSPAQRTSASVVIVRPNRAYPENTILQTFEPRNLKFHTFGDLYTIKKY